MRVFVKSGEMAAPTTNWAVDITHASHQRVRKMVTGTLQQERLKRDSKPNAGTDSIPSDVAKDGETISQHVRRVCGKPKDVGYRRLRVSLLPWGAMFWMVVVVTVGLMVALMSTQLLQHYASLLIRLSRGG